MIVVINLLALKFVRFVLSYKVKRGSNVSDVM